LLLLDANTQRIVAEATEVVKLAASHVFMMSGFSKGRKLHDENGDPTQ
jgi:hypothetical protein